jgi:hypothetical protein
MRGAYPSPPSADGGAVPARIAGRCDPGADDGPRLELRAIHVLTRSDPHKWGPSSSLQRVTPLPEGGGRFDVRIGISDLHNT